MYAGVQADSAVDNGAGGGELTTLKLFNAESRGTRGGGVESVIILGLENELLGKISLTLQLDKTTVLFSTREQRSKTSLRQTTSKI